MLKRAMWNLSLTIDILNRALNCGSSKQGKADLAYVGSKCVVAKYLQYNNANKQNTHYMYTTFANSRFLQICKHA